MNDDPEDVGRVIVHQGRNNDVSLLVEGLAPDLPGIVAAALEESDNWDDPLALTADIVHHVQTVAVEKGVKTELHPGGALKATLDPHWRIVDVYRYASTRQVHIRPGNHPRRDDPLYEEGKQPDTFEEFIDRHGNADGET